MAVPSTNVGLTDIQTEFGGSNPISLSEYYSGGPLVPASTPAPNGPIPSSGQISIGQFRGAAKVVTVDYLVVASGGGAGGGGGGGAGGYRTSGFGPAPLQGSSLDLSSGPYSITIGAGGNAGKGNISSFSTITSEGGGGGANAVTGAAMDGGSGGGGGPADGTGGVGNSPPVSPPQGNPGAPSVGGGGGATASGSGKNGGNGAPNLISGTPGSAYAGGGGGADSGSAGSGGLGGGGNGGPTGGQNGTANTGGGGGGNWFSGNRGSGGSGIVIVRSPTGAPMTAAPGTNTVTTDGAATVATFTVSGTLTIN